MRRRETWSAVLMAAAIAMPGPGTAAAADAPSPPDPITGTWLGTVTAPQGPAEIGFRFEPDPRGGLVFALYFPVMNAFDVSFGAPVTREGDAYTEPVFQFHLRLEQDTIRGTFGPGKLRLEMKRGGQFASAPPAPHFPAAPAPLWSCALGSPTWASPVVAHAVIYVGTQAGTFFAVNAADGSVRWTWKGPHRIDGQAVVTRDAVIFVDGRCELVCLAGVDGTLRWRVPLHDEKFAGHPVPDNPTFNHRTATPLVLDDVVYVGSSDGGLYALDLATGRKIWRHDAGAPIFSGVARVDSDGLAFGAMDGSVVVFDRATHEETLHVRVGGGVVTTPVVTDERIVVGSRDYFLDGLARHDGAVAWKYSYWFSWVESTGVLCDGVFYVGASDYRRVTALDPGTGRALWDTDVQGMDWGTPLVTDASVFIGTVAQNLPGTVLAHTGGIMALERRTGAVRWQLLAAPAPVNDFGGYAGSLASDGARLFAAGFDGHLIALPVD